MTGRNAPWGVLVNQQREDRHMKFTQLETRSVVARNANHAAPIYLHNKGVIGQVTQQQQALVDYTIGRLAELDLNRFDIRNRAEHERVSLKSKPTKALLLTLLEAGAIDQQQFDDCFSTTIIAGSSSIVRTVSF